MKQAQLSFGDYEPDEEESPPAAPKETEAPEPQVLVDPLIPEEPYHSDDPRQVALFDAGKSWENEWKGMPEFIQEDQEPFKTLIVHFESRADMVAFSRLVEQKITSETRSIWYPEAEIGTYAERIFDCPCTEARV